MRTQLAACVMALVAGGASLAEPPARHPQNMVQFPPSELEYRWFYLDPEFEQRARAEAERLEGAGGVEDDAARAVESGAEGGSEAEGEVGIAGIFFPASAMTLDEGIAALRESVEGQWPHEREVGTALDDLELFLRSLGADDAGMLFDGRTSAGYGFLRDTAEHHLVPASNVYAAVQSMGPGEEPPPRRATPPPAPPTPRELDPTLASLTDGEAYERVWRLPSGQRVAAIDVVNVLVDDEFHILSSERNPKWPHNGVTGCGTLFSSPATLTMQQRFSEPERAEDFLAIRVFVLTREGHTGMLRVVYRWDAWLGCWAPSATQTCVWAPRTSMWMYGF